MATTNVGGAPATMRHSMSVSLPTTLRFNIAAVLALTALIVLLSWLTNLGILPWFQPGGITLWYKPVLGGKAAVMITWFITILFTSLVLPLLTLLVLIRHASVRRVLIPYMALLIVQLVFETQSGSLISSPVLAVFVGLIYSVFRVWHLIVLQRYFAQQPQPSGSRHDFVRGLLFAGATVWALNVLFLVGFTLPRLVNAG